MADEVPQWAELAHAGFKEVQDLASAWWGQAAQFTRKGSSRKDFLMVSAELACLLQAVEVRHDVFPDHAQVTADFAVGDMQIPRLIWRQPRPPDGQRSTDQLPALISSDVDRRRPVNERYTSIFRSFEGRLSAARVEAGGQPLTAAQRGRATTLDVRPSRAKLLPPTKGREGEFVPHLPAPSTLHIQRYKQLRRLQALEQGLRRQSAALGNPQQRAELWRAIRHAPGFVPDFPTWAASTLPCCQEIPCFPLDPPPHAFAVACFEAFRNCVRSLEQQVSRQAAQTAKASRAKNPALIFKDLAKEWASPVETLVERQQAKVVEVREEEDLLVLDRPMQWWNGPPLMAPRGVLHETCTSEDAVWCRPEGIEVGHVIIQERQLGKLTEVFQAFSREWNARWVKLDHLRPGRWNQIVDSFQGSGRVMTLDPITESQWRAVVRSKPSRCGQGPDGIDRIDLLNLPSDLVAELLAIYRHSELTGEWPEQALVGLISALAKIEGAELAKHFRPITVFSLVYRVYSSLRSRQALAFIAEEAPVTMAGGMPGKSSVSVWWHIQLSIEKAYADGRPLLGACYDLSKAFNTLPRIPVYALAIKAGVHEDLVRSWSGAVSAVQRRFRARGSVGPPLLACCGFAEGCGLSVLAMALVDLALHQTVANASCGATIHSFVDDWQTLAVDAPSLALADRAVQTFAQEWDMELDPAKAIAWATTPHHRAALRSGGERVVLDARNLGGHCSYSRRCTNFTVTQRIQGMADLWPKLALSRAPYPQKLSALMTVAWPRGLHGCEAVRLGENWFRGLRTRALEGLGRRKPGAIHLSLASPTACDPGFKALEAAVMACRYWSKRDAVAPLLDDMVSGRGRVKTGPAAVLVYRMTQSAYPGLPVTARFMISLATWTSGMPLSRKCSFASSWHGKTGARIPGLGEV